MSVKVMGYVWDLDLPQNEKFILLAYADHADHDGNDIYPAVRKIAKKTGCSTRTVQRVTASLVKKGFLIPQGLSLIGTKRYRIPLPKEGGDIMTPPHDTGGAQGMTSEPEGGDNLTEGGDTAMSPESSFKPSLIQTSINHPPPQGSPRARRRRARRRQEEEANTSGLSTALSTDLQAAGVFRELMPEIAASGRSESELLALLAWSHDSGSETPGALFVSRVRSGADPPAKYFQPALECCGRRGEHAEDCPQRYITGRFADRFEH